MPPEPAGPRAYACPVPTVRDQAVCIRIWDWSETSQTVSLFGRELGILRGVAKGAKREGAPFSGGLEVLTRGEVIAIVKSNERSPDALATLTAWDLQETFPAARKSLTAFHAGLYMLDLIHHAVRDADPHPRLFDGLLAAFRGLSRPGTEAETLAWFQWLALKECGFSPELGLDVRTQTSLNAAPTYGFSASLGGFLADQDAGGDAGPDAGTVWRVRSGTIEFLRDLDRSVSSGIGPGAPSEGEILETSVRSPNDAGSSVGRANRLLAMYFQTILGRWPPSVHSVFPGIAGSETRGGA